MNACIHPVARLHALCLDDRGAIRARRATAVVAGLPRHIAERELDVIAKALDLKPEDAHVIQDTANAGPANVASVEIESERVHEVFTGVGQRGVRAEMVGTRVAGAAQRYIAAGVAAGEHLADQLLLPMALAGRGSFTTVRPTLHTTTNREVIERFCNTRVDMRQMREDAWRITVRA